MQSLYIYRGICREYSSTGNIDCHCPLISKIVVFVDDIFCFINDACRYHFLQIRALLVLSVEDYYVQLAVVVIDSHFKVGT